MTPGSVRVFAPAKINLTLHVTGKRTDGYHLLDSLVAFADVGDWIKVRPAPAWTLKVTGPMAHGVPSDSSNLILRAAQLMGGGPAAIVLEKHLPVASGIGGGSADAAATLRALFRMDARPLPDSIASLGADIPVCLHGQACRMRGIGEKIDALPPLPPCHAVLVNPGIHVATPMVFQHLPSAENPPMDAIPLWHSAADLADWLHGTRNDLEAPAISAAPIIRAVLGRLRDADTCLMARMSGSGATCFGLFPNASAAQAAAETLAQERPEWWVRKTTLS